MRVAHRTSKHRSQFFSDWLIHGGRLGGKENILRDPARWPDDDPGTIARGRLLSEQAHAHCRRVFTVYAFYKGSPLDVSVVVHPYLRFNEIDWFLQNVPTVNCPATTASVSIRASSAIATPTASTLAMNEIAVRISLDTRTGFPLYLAKIATRSHEEISYSILQKIVLLQEVHRDQIFRNQNINWDTHTHTLTQLFLCLQTG